jgi:hypothetical protein
MKSTQLAVIQEATALTDGDFCGRTCIHLSWPATVVAPPTCNLLKQTLWLGTVVVPMRPLRSSGCHEAERRAKGHAEALDVAIGLLNGPGVPTELARKVSAEP